MAPTMVIIVACYVVLHGRYQANRYANARTINIRLGQLDMEWSGHESDFIHYDPERIHIPLTCANGQCISHLQNLGRHVQKLDAHCK